MGTRLRRVLRLPYSKWSRLVDAGTLQAKRAEVLTYIDTLNAILTPQTDALQMDLILYGTAIMNEHGERVDPRHVYFVRTPEE